MKWRDYKYLLAYLGPASAYLSIYLGGVWSYFALIEAFVLIPVMELFLPGQGENVPPEEMGSRRVNRFFDVLLYLNVPILFGLITYLLWTATETSVMAWELIGMVIGTGIYVGASGINVAHELGHRPGRWDQALSKLLLIPGLYTHFFIEHNQGHHRYVATPADPATARYGESIYSFWWRSSLGSYRSAWKIELRRLNRKGISFFSWHNQMLTMSILQLLYLVGAYLLFGLLGLIIVLVIGTVGFLLLESINYIEHYGLMRKKIGEGKYERVGMEHSWNSNHDIGRILLYELTRHADHHYKASKKYQNLNHVEESPQLPTGYPGSMILALLPPLWFKVMNRRIPVAMLSNTDG